MERMHEQLIENEDVVLDGFHWSDCSFTNCNIILDKGVASLTNCHFKDCRLSVVENSPAIFALQVYEIFHPGSIKINR